MVIEGPLQAGEQATAIGEPDPQDGRLTSLSRIDLEYIDEWVDGDVLPVMMVLEGWSVPYPNAAPEPIPQQELTEGSHLGYAVQWFSFALIVVVGVAVLVYKAVTDDSVNETALDQTSLP
jgi:surfeit locus 1 family protein